MKNSLQFLVVILLALCLASCSISSSTPPEVENDLLRMVKNLPTKEALSNIGMTPTKQGTRSIYSSEQIEIWNISTEMDRTYSLLNENDLCKNILSSVNTEINENEIVSVGSVEFGGKHYFDVYLRYYTLNQSKFIDLKYLVDQYVRRFVTIEIRNYNTQSEVVYVSYFDSIENELPMDTDHEYTNRCNLTYDVSTKKMLLYRLYSIRESTEVDPLDFTKHSQTFMYENDGGEYRFYSTDSNAFEDFEYEGQFYPFFEVEYGRSFAFISLANGYAGRTSGYQEGAGGWMFHFYDETLTLVHVFQKLWSENSPDIKAIYMWPLRHLKSIDPSKATLYTDNFGDWPWLRLWVDLNSDGAYQFGEPRLQEEEGISFLRGVCGSAELDIPFFAIYVPCNVPPKSVQFNYHNNPDFASFYFVKQDFLTTNWDSVKTLLDDGITSSINYDKSIYPRDVNARNVVW